MEASETLAERRPVKSRRGARFVVSSPGGSDTPELSFVSKAG